MSRPIEPGFEASPPRLIDAVDRSRDPVAGAPVAVDPVAAALTAANRFWQADATEEARAWYALRRRRAPERRAGALVLAAVAIAVLAFLAGRRTSRSPEIASVPAPARPEALSGPPASSPREPIAAGRGGDVTGARASEATDASLPAPILGEVIADNGVRARLSRQGVATRLPDISGQPALALARGQLDVDDDGAPPPAPGAAARSEVVSVRASSLRILGDGGRFHVDTDGTRVGVTVQTGAVRIYSSRRLVARVVAGQRWSFAPRAGATPARAPAPEPGPEAVAEAAPAPVGPAPDCLAHARAGATDRAIACFQAQAASPGLSAEVALLEIARLRRDVSGDLGGAERALDEYRRRFPRGTLSAEAAVARVELLLRLGRPNDALVEARALPEGEGDFWRAVCLAKLGRRDEARAFFDGYLARPDAARRREAQRRRGELAP